MQHIRIATDHLPEREQFAFYREELLRQRFGLSGEREEPGSFPVRVIVSVDPSALRFQVRSGPSSVVRTPQDISRVNWRDWIAVYQEKAKSTRLAYAGQELVARKGDLLLWNPNLSVSHEAPSGFDHDIWLLPRKNFEPHLPAGIMPQLHLLRLEGEAGVVGLLRSFLQGLEQQVDALTDAELPVAIDSLCRLLAVACGGAVGGQHEAMRAGRLAAAKQYIARNLPNPMLSPAHVATAMKMSLRQLHRLFEPSGQSFEQYVVSQRLLECRAALRNPQTRARSITDIALGWGFGSLPSFYRNFAAAFGMSPGTVRAQAIEAPYSNTGEGGGAISETALAENRIGAG